jgi:hypothetical protein
VRRRSRRFLDYHMSKHLWEVHHPYYCADSNYYAPGMEQPVERYDSWPHFLEAEGDSDFDMNLLFRFDWKKADEDNEQSHDILWLFWMGQRKGLYRWSEVSITDDDELSVMEWLRKRFDHIKLLWEPFV